MRMNQLLALVIAIFICAVAAAESSIHVNALATDSIIENSANDPRYLKGSKVTTGLDTVGEERAAPNLGMLKGWLKLPKFQGLSKLPLVKQLAAIKKKFGNKIGDLYMSWVKKRYNSNPQNFV